MKALDTAAGGVLVPMLNTVTDAEAVVGACRYPPAAFRSMGPIRARLVDSDWRQPLCVVMVETVQAVRLADDILSVPGVDAVFVGPNDLAGSPGLDSSSEARVPKHRATTATIPPSAPP